MLIGALPFSLSLRSSPPPLPSRRRSRPLPCSRRSGAGPWGSNAEEVRNEKFGFQDFGTGGAGDGSRAGDKRRWWSDEASGRVDEDYGFFDDDDDEEEEDIFEKIWIFKVFKSYGYLLPAIIASLLLASGPKAFLMALALPLGQSALSLTFDMLGKERERKATPRYKRKNKPFNRSSYGFRQREYEENEKTRAGEMRQSYRSWTAEGADRPKKGNNARVGSFGGWDDLDENRGFQKKSVGRQWSETLEREKLSRRTKRRETPFFMRLLISLFPFLGSWTDML